MNVNNNNNNNAGNEARNMGPWGWEHGIAPGICTMGPGVGDWGHGWENGPWDQDVEPQGQEHATKGPGTRNHRARNLEPWGNNTQLLLLTKFTGLSPRACQITGDDVLLLTSTLFLLLICFRNIRNQSQLKQPFSSSNFSQPEAWT
jgi:hypothetical protein